MPKVAILITTMNRSGFLIRLLRYYASLGSPHPVYIGDGGDREHQKRTELAIEELQSQINIHYHYWPEINDRQTLKRLGEVAGESYCAYTGDDDFLIPDSLSKCAEFLEDNSEYRTSQGKAVLFSLKQPGPFGAMDGIGPYWSKKEAEEKTGVERILHFGQNYWVPQFSVHRRSEFVEDSLYFENILDRSFGELIHNFTFISKGKSKFIDCLYLLRQGHGANYRLPDAFDWLTGPDWYPSFQIFRDALTLALMETDGIAKETAEETVKQAFWAYLGFVPIKYQQKYGKSSSFKQNATVNGKVNSQESLRELVKKIPGTSQAAALLRNAKNLIVPGHEDLMTKEDRLVMRAEKGELSLPVLLHPSSPYHEDFLPVYEAITGQPVKL